MPRIPDLTSLGARPMPDVYRAQPVDRSQLMVAEGLADTSQALNRAAATERKKADKFAYAGARSALLQADIEARRTLENDPDWGTYEQRYTEAMGKAREKALGLIRDKTDMAEFEMQSNLDLQRGAAEIRAQARGKEVDWGRATLEESLAKNREAALNAKDERSRSALVASSQEMIAGAVERGYVKQEEAGAVQRKWVQEYGESVVEMLPSSEQVRILRSPQGTPADKIDPARRAAMLKQAEERVRIDEDRATNRALAMEARADAAKQRYQRNAADEAWKVIANGGDSADIPRDVWNSMDGRDQMAIVNDEKARLDGGKTPTDWNRYYELKQMAATDPDAFRSLPLTQDFDKLGPAERKELINLQQSAAGGADDLDAQALTKQVEIATAGWTEKERKGKFERKVGEIVNARSKELGRKLDQQERQQVIDNLLLEGEVRDGGLWNSSKPAFELKEGEDAMFVPDAVADEYDAIPEQERMTIKQKLASRGLPATPTNVLTVYRASRAQ